MIVLFVHGVMDYSAQTVLENYNPQKIYKQMRREHITELELERGLYIEIREFPFSEVSPEFKLFVDEMMGDEGNHTNFIVVED